MISIPAKTFTSVSLCVVLAACGGGGGSSTSATPADQSTAGASQGASSTATPASTGTTTGQANTASSAPAGSTSTSTAPSPSGSPTPTSDSTAGSTTNTSNIPNTSNTSNTSTTTPATPGNTTPPPGNSAGSSSGTAPTDNSANQGTLAVATQWTVKQVPVATGYISTYYQGLNDAGDAIGSYLISVNSGARSSSGIGVARSDGRVDTLGTLTGQTARGISINNTGQLAGTVERNIYAVELSQRGRPAAFLYSNGTTTEIPLPTVEGVNASAISSFATKLNNLGDVAGYITYTDAAGIAQSGGFVFSNNVRTDLVQPAGVTGTRAYGINDAKTVVGQADYADGTTRAFVYQSSAGLVPLGTLPSFTSSAAVAVNNNGTVTGTVFNKQGLQRLGTRPFVYVNGAMRAIPLPPSAGSGVPTAINTAGQVVGSFYKDDNTDNLPVGGFLYSGGNTIDLNSLQEVVAAGIKVTEALAINAAGQILVTAQTATGQRSFVLSPVK